MNFQTFETTTAQLIDLLKEVSCYTCRKADAIKRGMNALQHIDPNGSSLWLVVEVDSEPVYAIYRHSNRYHAQLVTTEYLEEIKREVESHSQELREFISYLNNGV